MKDFCVDLKSFNETMIYGIWMKSNYKHISRDISKLSKEYYEIEKKKKEEVSPFYVLLTNHKENTGDCQILVASTIEDNENGLEKYKLQAGTYASITVKPKFNFLSENIISEARKYFYKKWLPSSGYESLNFDYELHSEQSKELNSTLEIVFGIKKCEEIK